MNEGDDYNAMLVLYGFFAEQSEKLCEVRRDVYEMLAEEEWRVAMRKRQYLTSQCLDLPFESAWMTLYNHGHDTNVLNATSLTR
ncbi:hypothetical protein PHMEG_0008072 [Phytophthora megakarya]|uniref:Uncharacterized protein n=1 Tax=Phytophthora megakarya TaxID=4795 RepID=A0A225WKY9_9STRA|nr:hypothetical protein PHMEG_0008072 [Phytophthora megakarya]